MAEKPGRPPRFIESKSTERVKDTEISALKTVASEIKGSEAVCICREPQRREAGKALVVPWHEASEAP